MGDPASDPQSPAPSEPYDVIPLQAAPGGSSENAIAFRTQTYKWGPKMAPTGLGLFAAEYLPYACILRVTVVCRFTFHTGEGTVFKKDPSTGQLYADTERNQEWTDQEKTTWKAAFMSQASEFWTGSHRFNCTTKGMESFFAVPEVRFREATDQDTQMMDVHVYYTSTPEHRVACRDEFRSCVMGIAGYILRDEVNDMGARHEAGHMLGLGDEYAGALKSEAEHSALVEKEFGHKVIAGKVNTANGKLQKDSIMCDSANGKVILPEHGVVLLQVMREATGKDWQIQPPAVLKPDP